MNPPSVSVIIPTYKHRDFVPATLASVFAQTWADYEVIVVNDGSPDDTAAVLKPLAESGRIRYVEQPNAGQGAARNRGIAEARGEFIALLDDDDLWPADKLRWQVEHLRAHPDQVMVTGVAGRVTEDGALAEPEAANGSVQVLGLEDFFRGSVIHSPGQTLIRRTALETVGGFDAAIWGCDDMDLWMRLSARGPVALEWRCALYYRLHAGNASNAAGRMFWNAVRAARKNLGLLPPGQRGQAWHAILRNSYLYAGTRVVRTARGEAGSSWLEAARVLAFLALPAVQDAELARMIGRDLLPQRWHRQLRRAQPSTPGESSSEESFKIQASSLKGASGDKTRSGKLHG